MKTRHVPPRLARLAAAVMLVAGVVTGVVTGAAAPAAAYDCHVFDPPPVCGDDNNFSPTGSLDAVSRSPAGLVVSGTAEDTDASGPIQVIIKVAGVAVATLTASASGAFAGTVPAAPGNYLCAAVVNQNQGIDKGVGCIWFPVLFDPTGNLDEASPGPAGLHVRGWAIDPDTAAPIDVHVYVDGTFVTGLTASASRPDVGAVYPAYGSAHGYDFALPVAKGQHTVCTYGINVGTGTVNSQLNCLTVTQGGPPAAPSINLSPSSTAAQIQVGVNPHSGDATSFSYERSRKGPGGSYGPWLVVHTEGAHAQNSWSWYDTAVIWNTEYCYRVTARNSYGSAQSPEVCVRVLLAPLPKATNIFATLLSPTSLTLNWTDNAIDETSYGIYRAGPTSRSSPAHSGTGPTSDTLTGLQPGTQYCIVIYPEKAGHAYDAATFCVTTPFPPTIGVKTVNIWNCEPHGFSGGIWIFDHTVGGWSRVARAPSGWNRAGCGQTVSGPTASVNLPSGHVVTVAELIVDNAGCPSEDPMNPDCLYWSWGPLLGDSAGTVQSVVT